MATNKDLSRLMLDAYKPEEERKGYEEGEFRPYGEGLDLPNGLRIQAYINEATKEVVIGAAGTTGRDDVPTYFDYGLGGYHDQFREAVEYAYEVRGEISKRADAEEFAFYTTGHSHGGGVAQVLAYTFGWGGMTADAPQASAVVESEAYRDHLIELGIVPQGAGDLINYTEQLSLVSSVPFREYIGQHLELNLTPNTGTFIGAAMLLLPGPAGNVEGALRIMEDQWGEDGQHEATKFADFLSSRQDPNEIRGWSYVEGSNAGWYRMEPGTHPGEHQSLRASPEQAAILSAEQARRVAVNRQLEHTADDTRNTRPQDGREVSVLDPLRDDGGLNPNFVASFNNPDTVAEFFQVNAGLQLADADGALMREYAAYVYNKALAHAAASTGRDVSQILDLNVPGNPDAPGWHLDTGMAGHPGLADLAAGLGLGEGELVQKIVDGELRTYMQERQVDALQSQGIQTVGSGLGSVIGGLEMGSALDIVEGVAQLGLGSDRVLDGLGDDAGFLSEARAAGVQAGASAAAFVDDVLAGDELGAISSGAYFLGDLGDAGIDDLQGFTNSAAVGRGLGALALYGALEGDDAASVASAGFELANTVSDQALSRTLDAAFDVSQAVPYASYINAGANLVEGDIEQAGLSGVSGYLIATGNPVGIAAGVALSLLGGSLLGRETPRAWADFEVKEDGSIGVAVGSNDAGEGLEATVTRTAEFLTPVISHAGSYGIDVQQGYLPRIGIKEDEYYLEHGGATRLITDPQAELPQLVEMGVIGEWMLDNGLELWSRSGRHVYLGDTDWSDSVAGTGKFSGGGQMQHAPRTVDSKHVVSLNDPSLKPVARQLAEVQRTWRVDKSLFAGEGGALLAVGLGAGLVSYADLAQSIHRQADAISLVEHGQTAALIGDDNVIAAGYGLVGTGAQTPASTAGPSESDIASAPFYTGARANAYDDVPGRSEYQATDPISIDPSSETSGGTQSLPVFDRKGDDADDGHSVASRIRDLTVDTGNSSPIIPDDDSGSGGGGDGFGSGVSTAMPAPNNELAVPAPAVDFLHGIEDRFLLASVGELIANDGDGAQFLALGPAWDGTVTLAPNGDVRFMPPPDFAGQTGFSYEIKTVTGAVETREVQVAINGRNDRPEVMDDAWSVAEDNSVGLNRLLVNDTDVDGDALHIVAVSQVSDGNVVVGAGGDFRYVPPEDYAGAVQLVYVAEDAAGTQGVARASLSIENSENDPPALETVTLAGAVEEEAFRFNEAQLLDAARDPEGGGLAVGSVTALDGGTLARDRDTGEIVFTPDRHFHGEARLQYTVSDPEGLATTGTAGIVFENIVDPFSASDARLTVNEDEVAVFEPASLLPRLDIENPDDGEIAVVAVRMVPDMPGLVNHLPDGSVQWVPPEDYSGPSAFEVRLFNGLERVVSRIDLDIRAVDDAPSARHDAFDTAIEDTTFDFNAADLTDNDGDAEGDPFTVTGLRLLTPQAGALSFDPATGVAQLDPGVDFFGTARLEYTLAETDDGPFSTGVATVDFAPVDDSASISDKAFTLNEDEVALLPADELLDVTRDVDGESLAIKAVRIDDPSHGSVDLLPGGDVRFIPTIEFAGDAGFEFDYSDGVTTRTARVELSVASRNDAPEALDDSFTDGVEDNAYTFNATELLANDRDAEGDSLVVTNVRLLDPATGVLGFDDASGQVTLTPPPDFHGEAGLEYTVRAGEQTSTGSAAVLFASRDDIPVIHDKHFTLQEDESRLFTRDALLDVTTDADGETVEVTAARLVEPDAGALSVLDNGGVRFDPAFEFSGETSFELDYSDGVTGGTAQVTLLVEAVNDAPSGPTPLLTGALEDDVFEFNESMLLAGVTDPEGDPVSLRSVACAAGEPGAVDYDAAAGRIVYTPEPDWFGSVQLDYVLGDGRGAKTTQSASILVDDVQDDFPLSDRRFTISEDEARIFTPDELLDTRTDADGDFLLINDARLADATSGAVELLANGDVRFTPKEEFSGQAAFDYDVTDGFQSHTATANVTVQPVNDAPIAAPDLLAGAMEDTVFRFRVEDLLSNDTDPEGHDFRFTDVEVRSAAAGALDWDRASGNLSFTPTPDFFGPVKLEYTLEEQDSGQTSNGNTTILFQGVDDAPVVSDKEIKEAAFNLDEDEVEIFEARTLLDRAVDADGERLAITGARLADDAHGQVSLAAGGGIRFEPTADLTGEVPFEIDVSDGHSTVTATMTPRLWPRNDAPRVVDDVAVMNEDSILRVNGADLLANDSDVDHAHADLRIVGPWAASSGVAHYDAAADELRYMPADDVFGPGWIDYLVEDDAGAFSVSRLNVSVNNIDDPVRAVEDVLSIQEDTDRLFDPAELTGNDINPDREPLTVVAIDDAGVDHGRIALTAGGEIEYQAQADFAGEQSFTYTVEDEGGNQSVSTARLIVEPVNDAPEIALSSAQILEDQNTVFDVGELLDNANDIENDWMQVVAVRSDRGDVTFDAFADEVGFTPVADLNSDLNDGPLLLEYLVQDEKGAETWAQLDVNVQAVNDAPRAGDDTVFAWESGPGGYVNSVAAADLLANDVEVDGEPMRIDQVTDGVNGIATLDGGGDQIGYRADPGYIGEGGFTYRVTDDVLGPEGVMSAGSGEVTVNVLDNRVPVAHEFAAIASEDTILNFGANDFMAHVDDEDMSLLEMPENHRLVEVNDAGNGEVALNADGSVSFTPSAHYNSAQHGGVASFDYVVEDIVGNRAEATVSVTYKPVNDDPTAAGDRISQPIFEEQAAFINISDLLANDFDHDDNAGNSSVQFDGLAGGARNGSISVQGDQIRYIGDTDFAGADSFRYHVADDQGRDDTATVQLNVTAVNDRPVVQFDSSRADDSGANTIGALLNNDFDADGDALRIVNPSQGSVVNGGTGIRFAPDNRGHDYNTTITYGVTDGQATVQSHLDVHVTHVNRPPSGLTQIQTDADSVFVAGNDPDTADPQERFLGGTLSFAGYSWGAQVGAAAGNGAGQNGLFIDVRNQYGHPVSWPDPNQATVSGTGTFSYSIGVSDGDNEAVFGVAISLPVSLRNTNFVGKPVVIDANRDGFTLLGPGEGDARFDWDDDATNEVTGWIAGEGDALLAYDHDGDRLVSQSDEIAFTGYWDGAETDLEGLRAFDSNVDGVFDEHDEQWSEFGLWRDDGDGEAEEGEFSLIEASDVDALALDADEKVFDMNGNTVYGFAEVSFSDGSTGQLADVGFAINPDDEEAEAKDSNEGLGLQDADSATAETSQSDAPGDPSTMDSGTDEHVQGGSATTESADSESFGSRDSEKAPESQTSHGDSTTDKSGITSNEADAAAPNQPTKADDVTADSGTGDTSPPMPDGNDQVQEKDGDSADQLDLPSDEELDRMAASDNAHGASREPSESVAVVEVDTALNDAGNNGQVRDDEDSETDMAA